MRQPVVLFVIVALAAAGCASSKPKPERERVFLTDTSQFTWTGHSVDEVVQVFGRPSSRAPDATGLTVLTYDDILAIGNTPTKPGVQVDANKDDSDKGYDGTPSPQAPADRTVASKTKAQFWIDGEGKVQRFWFSPEMYRKGIPSPPSGASAGS